MSPIASVARLNTFSKAAHERTVRVRETRELLFDTSDLGLHHNGFYGRIASHQFRPQSCKITRHGESCRYALSEARADNSNDSVIDPRDAVASTLNFS